MIRPFGKIHRPYAGTVVTAERGPRVLLNTYPGCIIGIAFRLPDSPKNYVRPVHYALSIVWGKP